MQFFVKIRLKTQKINLNKQKVSICLDNELDIWVNKIKMVIYQKLMGRRKKRDIFEFYKKILLENNTPNSVFFAVLQCSYLAF